jgi:hypothetical protein
VAAEETRGYHPVVRLHPLVVIGIVVVAFAAGWLVRDALTPAPADAAAPEIRAPTPAPLPDDRSHPRAAAAPEGLTGPKGAAEGSQGATHTRPTPAPASAPTPASAPSPTAIGGVLHDPGPRPPPVAAPSDVPDEPPERMIWSVDKEGIQGAVRESLPDIRDCYVAWLNDNPALAGEVKVRFTISPRDEHGEVSSAAIVTSDLVHPLMEGCVMNVMRNLAFEPPSREVVVNYPIVLRTEE